MSSPRFFGIGIENVRRPVNIGTLWRSAFNLGASFIFYIGKKYTHQSSDTVKTYKHIPLFQYDSIDQLIVPYNCPLIGIELHSQAKDLIDYQHPSQAIYLLGSENNGLSKKAIDKCNHLIQFDSHYCMNVACAGSVIMWDRKIKGNK